MLQFILFMFVKYDFKIRLNKLEQVGIDYIYNYFICSKCQNKKKILIFLKRDINDT